MKKLFLSVFVGFLLFCVTSCGMSQKIKVTQSQKDQNQQVEVEHTGKVENLSLHFMFNPQNPTSYASSSSSW